MNYFYLNYDNQYQIVNAYDMMANFPVYQINKYRYCFPKQGVSYLTSISAANFLIHVVIVIIRVKNIAYLNPEMFHEAFVQDANATEAETLAVVQKPAHQSLFTELSGPPAWKQHTQPAKDIHKN